MRKIILYIAMSLDGYIADKNGNVAWLSGDGSETENQGSYGEFVSTIDTVILGYKTYHQIVTELSPDQWIYADKKSYVITHKKIESQENIMPADNLIELIQQLKSETGKDIWICGGAEIVNQLIDVNLIDRYYVTIIPILLGEGIRLFDIHEKELPLSLISTCRYNGMIDLVYENRK